MTTDAVQRLRDDMMKRRFIGTAVVVDESDLRAVLKRLEAAERVCRVLEYHLDEEFIKPRQDEFEAAAFAELKEELDVWNASAGDKL
jgi:hypothetical protein